MLINLRNALMAGKRLPYDAEVEYLQSTGTQWIDTGVYGNLDTVVEFRAAATANDALYPVFGARISYNQKALAVYNGSDVGYKYTASYDNISLASLSLVSDVSADVGAWVDFHIGKSMSMGSWQKDTTSYASSFTTAHTLCVFAWNQNGTITCGKYKVSYLKIWQNGVLVRDFIPVRKGTTGELYDRVTGKFAERHGDLVVGQDVVPVEYIESHGTEYIDTGFIPGLNFHIDVRGRKAGDYSANAAIFSNEGVNSYVDCYYNAGWGVRCYGNGMTRSIYDGWFDAKIDFDFTSSPTTTFHLNSEEATATTSKTEAQITGSTKSVRLFQGMYGKTNPVDIVFFNADKNSQPALRLRAVRVGTDTTSWEGAMMDVLTRRVYRNAGTGAFTYGNDLKYPIPAS